MSIEIHPRGDPSVSVDLPNAGHVAAWAPVAVTRILESGRRIREYSAFALRWEHAPPNARLTQLPSLRAYFLSGDGRVAPVRPSSPMTDVATAYGPSFALSATAPQPRTWHLDAGTHTGPRDPGRAYVSDESYGFSEREADALEFYDSPTLAIRDPVAARDRNGIAAADAPRYELAGLFATQAWAGRRLLGMVEWSRIWTYQTAGLGAVTTSSEGRYPEPPRWTQRRTEGPTRAESLRLIGQWQRVERRRPP